jgi:uncharacterized protein (DUF4415 family)
MSKQHIVRYNKSMKDKTDWARVKAMTDDDIDYSDIPATDAAFWATAKLVTPEAREYLNVDLDRGVVSWFKEQEPDDYQRKISAVLKTYIEAQKSLTAKKKTSRKAAS